MIVVITMSDEIQVGDEFIGIAETETMVRNIIKVNSMMNPGAQYNFSGMVGKGDDHFVLHRYTTGFTDPGRGQPSVEEAITELFA